MKTTKLVQVIAAVIGMFTGIVLVDGEPTAKELLGGVVLIIVVVSDLLVTAYRNEFKERNV
ncbi:hypothetical protein [Bacteroides sp.]|jgi:putative Mn2+ efflux pump MntP|uniref:hypothetical protein n=1 Tax=Bacteroides sp. TaxID=29523 RepID=UPI0025C17C39|nr:hypothetical protein [Bacteroides sp.]